MRLTTKIITGIILSIFLLSLLHIIGYSFTERKNYHSFFTDLKIILPQADKTGIHIESYRAITLESERSDTSRYDYYYTNEESGFFINPATNPSEENILFIPEALSEFITTQINNDTLTVKIKLDEVREKYCILEEAKEDNRFYLRRHLIAISGVNLYLHTTNINVINRLNGVPTQISNMDTDSIKIYANGEITVDSCKANVIEPNSNRKITVTNSVANMLNIDLDRINNWNIDNCDIEATNYTGSRRNHNIIITRNERGTINWLPKNKEAELSLKFKGDSAHISYQLQ